MGHRKQLARTDKMSYRVPRSAGGPRSTLDRAREHGTPIPLTVDQKSNLTLTHEAAAILARIVREHLEVSSDKQAGAA